MKFANNRNIRETTHIVLYLIASAVMLTLAQAPINWWPFAWVAYVPFALVCTPQTKPLGLCLAAYIVGTCYWLGNIYWMSFVTAGGWVAFCLYTGLLWPILAISLRWCRAKGVPFVIALPILVVGIEQSQGLFLGGFYWLHLAHSQYANITLIQIADIFGAAGVSFLVGMVNGVIAQLIITVKNSELRIKNLEKTESRGFSILNSLFSIIIVIAAVAGTIVYGKWRVNQSDKFITTGPMVASVQTNVAQSVKQTFAAEEEIFDELVRENGRCISAGAKAVIWPETMVQAILEPDVLRLLEDIHQYKLFDRIIKNQAQKGAYILVGAYGGRPRIEENFDIRMAEKYNAALLYRPDGNLAVEKYYKIHLVPFGEYIPFKKTIPVIHKLMLAFTPYDFDYTLDAGNQYAVFKMADANDIYRFGAMICYEDAVAGLVRHLAVDDNGNKRIDWLVNISNDGWFVRFKDDEVLASTELDQHTAVCALRAVENRLSIIRSVNTGISCLIDSAGRIKNGYAAGNLPKEAFERKGIGGWFADNMPIDKRVTIFSRYGQWLDFSCQLGLAGIIIAQLIERFVLKRRKTKFTGK